MSRWKEKGQAMAEFALIMPVLIMLMFGMTFDAFYAFRSASTDWGVFITGVASGSYNTPATEHARDNVRLQGLSVAERQDVDLILLDINLPDIDGYEVARRLRASSKHSLASTPIIAITANALKGDAEKALDAGCDVYMSKPINIRELWARVEAFVPMP